MIDEEDFKFPDDDSDEIEIEFIDDDNDNDDDQSFSEGVVSAEVEGEHGTADLAASRIAALEDEISHLREMNLRKLAEFDNFRKRTERERIERDKLAGLEVVQDLIPVIDNFERALGHASESSFEALEQGVGMIAKQLTDVLERRGLEIFDPKGEVFDPECHEAIQRVEDPSLPVGTVAWVLAKGFRFGGRLLRPAMVGVVAGNPEGSSMSDNGEGNAP